MFFNKTTDPRISSLEWQVEAIKRVLEEERETRRILQEDLSNVLKILKLEVRSGRTLVYK